MRLSHDYAVCVRRLREAEGGGYIATIPQLGTGAFHGDGETLEEALEKLEIVYNHLVEELTKEGTIKENLIKPVDEDYIATAISMMRAMWVASSYRGTK